MSTTNSTTVSAAYDRVKAAEKAISHLHWMHTYVYCRYSQPVDDAATFAALRAELATARAEHAALARENIAIRRSVRIEDRNARAYNRFAAIARKRAAAAPEPQPMTTTNHSTTIRTHCIALDRGNRWTYTIIGPKGAWPTDAWFYPSEAAALAHAQLRIKAALPAPESESTADFTGFTGDAFMHHDPIAQGDYETDRGNLWYEDAFSG